MLEFTAYRSSVPNCIYQEEVISDSERETAKSIILRWLSYAGRFEVINPFADEIQRKFADDAGYKTRQLGIFLSNVKLHTLVNAQFRPKFEYKDTVSVITRLDDVIEANKLTKKPTPLPPAKIRFFNQNIRTVLVENGKLVTIGDRQISCLAVSEMIERISIYGMTDGKKLQETYLKPLTDSGYLEKDTDPNSRNRHLYFLPAKYLQNEASLESTLFDNIDIDVARVKSFIERTITRLLRDVRLEGRIGTTITPDDLLDEILNRQDEMESMRGVTIVDSSKNVEGEKHD